MAGEALTSSFLLGSATVMLGKMAQLWDLTPASNSIGLVKNFTINTTPTFLDLTQGSKGEIVYSAMVSNAVKATCEVFEYTSQNIAYGLGLDGSTFVPQVSFLLSSDAVGGSTTATFSNPTNVSAYLPINAWIALQDGTSDHVHYALLTVATSVTGTGPYLHTVTFANQGLKTGNNFLVASGSTISIVNRMDLGSPEDQLYYSAKIVTILPEADQPIGILLPKVRIIKGFSAMFATDHYGMMPFELQPLSLIPSDIFYATFQGKGSGMLMAKGPTFSNFDLIGMVASGNCPPLNLVPDGLPPGFPWKDGQVICVAGGNPRYPTSDVGLSPGSVWISGNIVCVSPGSSLPTTPQAPGKLFLEGEILCAV